MGLFLLIVNCGSAEGWTTMYKKFEKSGMRTEKFNCTEKADLTGEKIVQIKAEDIKSCYLTSNRTTWLLFLYTDCMGDVAEEVKLYRKYKDKMDLVVISQDYNLQQVKEKEALANFPIYFIDPTLSNSRTKTLELFIKQIFGEEKAGEAAYHTSVFARSKEVVGFTYDVDDVFLENILTSEIVAETGDF